MSTPSNDTSRPLMRLVDRLGTSPDLERSGGWHWRMVVSGAVLFALNALPEAGWVSSPADQYARLLWICLGLTFVSQGASGLLLRRGKEALSLWFSVLWSLLFLPTTILLFLLLYEWRGLAWAVAAAVAACALFYAVHWKRSRRYDEGA